MRLPSEFGIQRHAQLFSCVLIRNSVMVDIDWLVLDTLVVIMIPKPGKPPHESTSYRPISLLPIMLKLFEKLLLKKLKLIIEDKNLIPDHQFGFRTQHSMNDQVHRITNIIERSLEEIKVCSTLFLDVAQAFDKVWHEGLNHKLNRIFRIDFWIKHEDAYSDLRKIHAGVLV
jgi:hypothetical protein